MLGKMSGKTTMGSDASCRLGDCTQPAHCRGLCRSHYTRWVRQGRPLPLSEWLARDGCALGTCVECGRTYPLNGSSVTCSDECSRERQRRRDRKHFHRSEKRRLTLRERAKQRRREKPEQAHEADARKWARLSADPQRMEARRQKTREWYARHAERVQEKRRERLAAMSDEEIGELAERSREYTRAWRRRQKQNPEHRAKLDAYQQEYRRRRREAKATEDLARLAALLAGRENASKIKPCAECGKPVVGKSPLAKYCSRECSQLAGNRRHYPPRPRPCIVCGKTFAAPTAARCCSPECRRARRLGVTLEQLPPLETLQESATCDVCGREFKPARPRQRGCSRECRRIGQLRRKLAKARREPPCPPRPCEVCGETYPPTRRTQRLCGNPECAAEAKRLAMRKGPFPPRPCATCGTEFVPLTGRDVSCSPECRRQRHRERQRTLDQRRGQP